MLLQTHYFLRTNDSLLNALRAWCHITSIFINYGLRIVPSLAFWIMPTMHHWTLDRRFEYDWLYDFLLDALRAWMLKTSMSIYLFRMFPFFTVIFMMAWSYWTSSSFDCIITFINDRTFFFFISSSFYFTSIMDNDTFFNSIYSALWHCLNCMFHYLEMIKSMSVSDPSFPSICHQVNLIWVFTFDSWNHIAQRTGYW